MEICSGSHEEIVHNERNCPLCVANEKIPELEQELTQVRADLLSAEIEITSLYEQANDPL
jgi:hypothetical protein